MQTFWGETIAKILRKNTEEKLLIMIMIMNNKTLNAELSEQIIPKDFLRILLLQLPLL